MSCSFLKTAPPQCSCFVLRRIGFHKVASSFHCCSHHLRTHSLCSLLHEIANHSFDQRREASLNATGSYMFWLPTNLFPFQPSLRYWYYQPISNVLFRRRPALFAFAKEDSENATVHAEPWTSLIQVKLLVVFSLIRRWLVLRSRPPSISTISFELSIGERNTRL